VVFNLKVILLASDLTEFGFNRYSVRPAYCHYPFRDFNVYGCDSKYYR
jgi:hypothetical protein